MKISGFGWPVALVCGLAACASQVAGRAAEVAGTPSATGCDAWLNIGGTFSRLNHDVRYTLSNRSTNSACLATRATVLFAERVPRSAVRVPAPPGWTAKDVPCQTGGGRCGVEWHSRIGVPAGDELSGFGLAYDPTMTPRQKIWIVDVGSRRVEMPIGTVGGLFESTLGQMGERRSHIGWQPTGFLRRFGQARRYRPTPPAATRVPAGSALIIEVLGPADAFLQFTAGPDVIQIDQPLITSAQTEREAALRRLARP